MISVTDEWIGDLLVELGIVDRDENGLVYRCGTGMTLEDESISYMLTNYEHSVERSYELVLDEIRVAILTEIEDDILDACMDFWEGTPETYASDIDYIKMFVWRKVRIDLDEGSLRDTRACMNITYYGTDTALVGIEKDLLSKGLPDLADGHTLSWLLDTQGYTLDDVRRVCEEGTTDSVFLKTLIEALREMESDIPLLKSMEALGLMSTDRTLNLITFFVSMRWGDVLELLSSGKYVKLYPNTRVGFYDLHHDTVYDFSLEYGLILDQNHLTIEFDGAGGVRDFASKTDEFFVDSYY